MSKKLILEHPKKEKVNKENETKEVIICKAFNSFKLLPIEKKK